MIANIKLIKDRQMDIINSLAGNHFVFQPEMFYSNFLHTHITNTRKVHMHGL